MLKKHLINRAVFPIVVIILAIYMAFSCKTAKQYLTNKPLQTKMSLPSYTENTILAALDDTEDKFFIDLEHAYVYTVGSRISLYANEQYWAVVLEKSGFNTRTNQVEIELNYFGNCINLHQSKAVQLESNTILIPLVSAEEYEDIILDWHRYIKPDVEYVNIRGNTMKIEHDIEKYKEQRIIPPNKATIRFEDVIRYLFEQHKDSFYATDSDIQQCLPKELPKIFVINEWHYKPYNIYYGLLPSGDKPSSYETFQLIAKILTTKDTTLWKPVLKANNDWRNYPNAGNL